MYTRFITYDLNYADTDDYSELYGLIKKYHGKKITESTYQLKTTDDWDTFKNNFLKATNPGDSIKAIVLTKAGEKKEMTVWTIR